MRKIAKYQTFMNLIQIQFLRYFWNILYFPGVISTSTCRMTITFLLTLSIDVKDSFAYLYHVLRIIFGAHTTVQSGSFNQKHLKIAKLELLDLFKKSFWARLVGDFSRKNHFYRKIFTSMCRMTIIFLLTHSDIGIQKTPWHLESVSVIKLSSYDT